jgi:hypothetical protein
MAVQFTYVPIATQTLGSAASTITFSSIPQTYTDLRLVLWTLGSAGADCMLNLNSDTGTNYSFTQLLGSGSAASSYRTSSRTFAYIDYYGYDTTNPLLSSVDFLNYSNTTTYKSFLATGGDTRVGSSIGLWRSTSAISTILLTSSGANFAAGATFTLYGLAAA